MLIKGKKINRSARSATSTFGAVISCSLSANTTVHFWAIQVVLLYLILGTRSSESHVPRDTHGRATGTQTCLGPQPGAPRGISVPSWAWSARLFIFPTEPSNLRERVWEQGEDKRIRKKITTRGLKTIQWSWGTLAHKYLAQRRPICTLSEQEQG